MKNQNLINAIYEPTGLWLVDVNGNCRPQQPTDRERQLSHIARERADRYEIKQAIGMITGQNSGEYYRMQIEIGKAWLYDYLRPLAKGDDVLLKYLNDDVSELFEKEGIANWWLNHWAIREQPILTIVAKYRDLQQSILKNNFREALDAGMPIFPIIKSITTMCFNEWIQQHLNAVYTTHYTVMANSYESVRKK